MAVQCTLPVPPWCSQTALSHLTYGGVIDAEWTFYSNHASLLRVASKDKYMQRRLRHIIDPTRKVKSFTPARPRIHWQDQAEGIHWLSADYPLIHWCGALPLEGIDTIMILCPWVYSASKWVMRRLSPLEIRAAFDIPETLKVPTEVAIDAPFMKEAPSRLLGLLLGQFQEDETMAVVIPVQPTQPCWPQLEGLQWEGEAASTTKADDAEAPIEIWNSRVLELRHDSVLLERFGTKFGRNCLDCIRGWVLCVWRKRILESLMEYLRREYDHWWIAVPGENVNLDRDLEVGRDCLYRASLSTWWEWPVGSTPFYWRWPSFARALVRDGHSPWLIRDPPRFLQPQQPDRDPEVAAKIKEKLENVSLKGYIRPGTVHSLTRYFAVPKSTTDIRMVYDATVSGLNDCLWVPSFVLPDTNVLTNLMDCNSWMGDLDMGEQFLNFPMHPRLQICCGIDVRPYLGQAKRKTMWWRWTRCMMGLKPSPYFAIKGTFLAEEVVKGNRLDRSNPYHWESVLLNLPGSPSYTPSQPWVQLLTHDGKLAGNSIRYVDDLRLVGHSQSHCWELSHRLASTFSFLGLQIALRKFRPPTRQPGPWAGTIAFSSMVGVGITCPTDKWGKAKHLLATLQETLLQGGLLERLPLESMRGFLNHLARTYPVITPYLKGFHLTLDGWRGNRSEDMWKLPHVDWIGLEQDTAAPDWLQPAPRLGSDVQCLLTLFAADTAPTLRARCTDHRVAIYGFVDASSTGHRSSFTLPDGTLLFRHGLWGRDTDSLSSNFWELCNLVESVEEAVHLGELQGSELFIFTDNTTAEGGYYRGNSDNRILFSLILRLRLLEMNQSLHLHIVHVAGTRMIQQGTDGLSRGMLTDGVFGSQPMALHIPLHLDAVIRSPSVLGWLRSWCPDSTITPLTPLEWFTVGHGLRDASPVPIESSTAWFAWAPAPAAARHALEELATSRHKRTDRNHIFICPRLFTSQWRKLLYKLADAVIEFPAGSLPCWPLTMHEPLILGLTLRFVSTSPWRLRNHQQVLDMVGALREMRPYVSGSERPLLRQLCQLPAALETVSSRMAR
jgi:hypothetical protein